MLRDIRDHMPTPRKGSYPDYEYRPYPRMMKDEKGKPFKNPDGSCVIVDSKAEENYFLGKTEEVVKAPVVAINPVEALTVKAESEVQKRKYTKRALPADLT
jgi:hypothetical protein